MAMTNLFSTPAATFVKQPLHTHSSSNPNLRFSPLNFRAPRLRKPRTTRKFTITSESKDSNSADAPDRLISAITYFYPFFDGIQYGKYVITQFSPFQTVIQPLVPAIKIFKSFPFNGFLVFLTLYFVVVRNPNFSRYVRFNTMQAIVLDVLLIFPDLLERSFSPRDGVGLDIVMSLDSTVFLFLFVCLIYGSSSCLLGQLPRLPLVAEAADRIRCNGNGAVLSQKMSAGAENGKDRPVIWESPKNTQKPVIYLRESVHVPQSASEKALDYKDVAAEKDDKP